MFGMVDTSHSPALGFVEVVQTRDAATLLPIIRQHIAPGSTVHSDEWRAYNRIQSSSGLTHGVVNHSLHFVDPTTGIHTHVESYWNRIKIKLKRMRGVAVIVTNYQDTLMNLCGVNAMAKHQMMHSSTSCVI